MTYKNLYYTAETIEQQAQKFLAELQEFRAKHQIKIAPEKTALLVIDMQDFFVDSTRSTAVLNAPAIIPNIQKLQEYFLNNNLIVMQTRHTNTLENCGQMYEWWGKKILLEPNNPAANIVASLKNPRIPILNKTQYDAFWQTDLEQQLRNHGITQLIITGVMAHLCCETTARSAFVRGFKVFFTIDATATHNAEFHLGTLRNLAHGVALPVLTSEVLTSINAK
jgi:bifunctional isochorismate lyase/aryl carrier protein